MDIFTEELSRRDFIERLYLLISISALGCQSRDPFDREKVCAHIYRPAEFLPEPLLASYGNPRPRSAQESAFNVGLPELALCSMKHTSLHVFEYLWPITRDEFRRFESGMSIVWKAGTIDNERVLTELRARSMEKATGDATESRKIAVIFTFNTYTRYWASAVSVACRESGVDELIVFKDPTVAPYLCDHPSLQKGFKRPP